MATVAYRLNFRRTVFTCEPKFRKLRGVSAVGELRAFRRAGLKAKMNAHWHSLRTHSSWSRA